MRASASGIANVTGDDDYLLSSVFSYLFASYNIKKVGLLNIDKRRNIYDI